MGILLGVLIVAGLVMSQGMIWVEVQEHRGDGTHIVLPVPVSLVRVAVAAVPDEEIAGATREAAQWLPVVEAACREIEKMPDTVLVQVHDKSEDVRIEKRGDYFYIDVESGNEEVHVSFPVGAVTAIVEDVAAAQSTRL